MLKKAIRHAEEKDNMSYGVAFWDNGDAYEMCFVNVRFYPNRKWFVMFEDGKPDIEITKDNLHKIKKLKL